MYRIGIDSISNSRNANCHDRPDPIYYSDCHRYFHSVLNLSKIVTLSTCATTGNGTENRRYQSHIG